MILFFATDSALSNQEIDQLVYSSSSYVPSEEDYNSSSDRSVSTQDTHLLIASENIRENVPQTEEQTSRKWVCNKTNWKCTGNIRNRLRNQGKSYTTRKGILGAEKKFIKVECTCSLKCDNQISFNKCEKVFSFMIRVIITFKHHTSTV